MDITDIRVKPIDTQGSLLAAADVMLDDVFIVHDVKIVQSRDGSQIVSMPSRKTTDHCPGCRGKTECQARYCAWCGVKLGTDRVPRAADGRQILTVDVAHPVSATFRWYLVDEILRAYREAVEVRANTVGYGGGI